MSKVKKIHLFGLMLSMMLMTGCQKTVYIDGGQISPRLVVNSILQKDSLFKIQLSKSKSMMDSKQSISLINSAIVKIFEANILKHQSYLKELIFYRKYLPAGYAFKLFLK